MSLLRYDITTNNWVIFSPERARRPHEWKRVTQATTAPLPSEDSCPFCTGNERLTGPEIYALRGGTAPNTPSWSVRVVPNKFPALRIEDDVRRLEDGHGERAGSAGFYVIRSSSYACPRQLCSLGCAFGWVGAV